MGWQKEQLMHVDIHMCPNNLHYYTKIAMNELVIYFALHEADP